MKKYLTATIAGLIIASSLPAQKVVFEGLKDINGTQLYFTVIGTGEPLLVVHGGPGLNHNYFIPHLNDLAKKYQLIFYDQRSAGKSQLNVKANMNLNTFAQDIEAIRIEFHIDKLNILCHSWGALPVSNYIASYPDHIGSVIFCNPVPLSQEYARQIAEIARARMTPEDSTKRAEIIATESYQKGDMSAINGLMHLSFKELFCDTNKMSGLDLQLPENYMVASLSLYGLLDDMKKYNFYNQFSQLHCPVLIIHGNCDLTPLEIDQRLQSAIPGSQLEIFEESGHFPFIEEHKKFTKTVLAFLKKVPTS